MGKTRDELLEELNPAQREAVAHMEGALMVLAGAGSGKTRVITHRIAHLLRSGVQSDSVLAITFTNKAASEMKERTEQLCGSSSPWVSTFHSFSARLLRRHAYRIEPYDSSFTVCDRDDCKALVKTILKEQNIDSQLWDPAGLLSSISKIKNVQQGDDALLGSDYKHGQVLRDLYNLYTEAMRERNLLDFDDLLLLSVQLLEENEDLLERYQEQFQYILIDEYQDTNAVQYRISSLLAKSHGNLCITGDPDQSIYHWRGADINNILNFEKDYPGARIILLEQNYRSTGNILSTANALISRNIERKPKDLWTENPAGNPVRVYRFLNEMEEAREIVQHIPKIVLVAPSAAYTASSGKLVDAGQIDLVARAISMRNTHRTFPGTVSMCTAVAAQVEGTVVHEAARQRDTLDIRIGHPAGVMQVGATVSHRGGEWSAERVTTTRTARRIMEGSILVPQQYLDGRPWFEDKG